MKPFLNLASISLVFVLFQAPSFASTRHSRVLIKWSGQHSPVLESGWSNQSAAPSKRNHDGQNTNCVHASGRSRGCR